MKDVHGFFDYRDPNFGNDSSCFLRVYKIADGVTVAVATELADNKGPSITNSAETLWCEVVKEYGLDPTTTYFVEHYPHRGTEDETYDFVELHWYDDNTLARHPKWRHVPRQEVEKLIGEPLGE